MPSITFSREEKQVMVRQLQAYFDEEMDQSIGVLPAEMLLDFIASNMGRHYYNRGLYDAAAALEKGVERLSETILSLEA